VLEHRRVGAIDLVRIVETERPEFSLAELFPSIGADAWRPHNAWFHGRDPDPAIDGLVLSVQAFLIRTPTLVALVDSCVGDHKERWRRVWTGTSSGRFLERLRGAGVRPEEVDVVISTHLHADHVGWNTRLADGIWQPTFPNAAYLIADREWADWRTPRPGRPEAHIEDSVRPIVEAGRARFVADRHVIADAIRLEPTPGHTPGHVSITVASGGREAVITGDVLHHPVQCVEPDWWPSADRDPALATRTRRAFLERYADRDVLVCGTHFPSPSFGRISARGGSFRFAWDEA
jgi:glyoxylase-like metal-dependent hydrolase (beta-lactamase superfamily II)